MEKGEKGSEGYVNPNISLPPSLDPRKDEIITTRLGPAEPNFEERRKAALAALENSLAVKDMQKYRRMNSVKEKAMVESELARIAKQRANNQIARSCCSRIQKFIGYKKEKTSRIRRLNSWKADVCSRRKSFNG